MPNVWSDKAVEEQRSVNRFVRSLREDPSAGERIGLFPTLVRAQEDIPPGGSGYCVFREGLIDADRQDDATVALMHNLVSDTAITAGKEALAQRIVLPGSNEAGWLVLRIPQGEADNNGQPGLSLDCAGCHQQHMPVQSLRIADLLDFTTGNGFPYDDPTYDGWAAELNDKTWELSHSFPHSVCSPGQVWTLPNNSDNGGSPFVGPFANFSIRMLGNDPLTQMLFIQGEGADREFRNIQFNQMSLYAESTAGPGLMTRLTDDSGFERVDCTQTYSNYAKVNDFTSVSENFSQWLDNGTFTLNP